MTKWNKARVEAIQRARHPWAYSEPKEQPEAPQAKKKSAKSDKPKDE